MLQNRLKGKKLEKHEYNISDFLECVDESKLMKFIDTEEWSEYISKTNDLYNLTPEQFEELKSEYNEYLQELIDIKEEFDWED